MQEVEIIEEINKFHPFQTGLIYKKQDSKLKKDYKSEFQLD